MKAYILKDEDFDRLLAAIDRDPQYGIKGGTTLVLSAVEKEAHKEAHRFYNYTVRTWISRVKD